MSFFDFDDMFGEFDTFHKDFAKRIQKEMEELEEATKSGKLDGKWDVKEINKPGIKGFVVRGYFSSNKPLEPEDPLEPLKPLRKRPSLPATSFKIPKNEVREPLTDIMEEENAVKVYVELPGEEESNIKTNFVKGKLEIKANNFLKTINLPTEGIDTRKAELKYKNGVLEIAIPKKRPLKPDYKQV